MGDHKTVTAPTDWGHRLSSYPQIYALSQGKDTALFDHRKKMMTFSEIYFSSLSMILVFTRPVLTQREITVPILIQNLLVSVSLIRLLNSEQLRSHRLEVDD
ncbi:MAG: hypothetical protein KKD63_12215 [Proteobacteria bacterium]|nr:hypothetical protein [Desulfobulbaceae bacterium]MBU4153635.1 hypothetical protein [Pseudomonadota bacterium]